jgi:hypothetical protein
MPDNHEQLKEHFGRCKIYKPEGRIKKDVIKESGDTGGGVMSVGGSGELVIENDATNGGEFIGKRHSQDGGIKAINVKTGQPLLVETDEVIITRDAVLDPTTREFEGQHLTNKQILSRINAEAGGVSFENGGDVPDCLSGTGSDHKYNYNGKQYEYGTLLMEMNSLHCAIVREEKTKATVKAFTIPNLDLALRINLCHRELLSIGIDNKLKYGSFELNGKSYDYHFYIDLLDGNIVDYEAEELLGYSESNPLFNSVSYGRIYFGDIVISDLELSEEQKNELLAAAALNDEKIMYSFAIKIFNSNQILTQAEIDENRAIAEEGMAEFAQVFEEPEFEEMSNEELAAAIQNHKHEIDMPDYYNRAIAEQISVNELSDIINEQITD